MKTFLLNKKKKKTTEIASILKDQNIKPRTSMAQMLMTEMSAQLNKILRCNSLFCFLVRE